MVLQVDAINERCAGIDIHKDVVTVCALIGALDRKPQEEIREYSTATQDLLALSEWLGERGITDIAMESTGIYWKPVWRILAGSEYNFKLLLANARTIKNVPGRKTDKCDARWIAKLTRAGLIEGSFVPPEDIEELRELTRYRKRLRRGVPRLFTETRHCVQYSANALGRPQENERVT